MSGNEDAGVLLGVLIVLGVLLVFLAGFVISLVKAISTKTRGWVIATVVCAAMSVGVIPVALVIAVIVKRQAARGPAEGSRHVTSTDGAVSLVVPAAWRDLPELNDEAVLSVGNELAEEYLLVIREDKADFAGSLESYADVVAGDMLETVGSKDELRYEPVSFGGCAGLRVGINGVVDRTRIVFDLTMLETDDSYCQILCWTLPSRAVTAQPKFDAALASFLAVAGAPAPGEEQQDDGLGGNESR
jgi:hypothetical protein